MRKTIIAILSILFLVILACLALPKYYSSQNKMFVQNALNSLQQIFSGQVTGKIVKESNGWFCSKSIIELDYQFTNIVADKKPISGKFDLLLTTHYGPVVFTQRGLRIAQAYLEYTLQNNPQSAKHFSDPLLQGRTIIGLLGKVKLNATGLKTLPQSLIQFDGLTIQTAMNKNFTKIHGKILYGQLQAIDSKNPSDSIVVAPFTQTFELSRANANALWSGKKALKIPSIIIRSTDIHAELNNVSLKSNITLDQKFLNGALIICAPDFIVNNQHGTYHTVLTLKNLDSNAFNQIRNLSNGINLQNASPQAIQMYGLQLSHTALNVFSGSSVVQFNSKLNFKGLGVFVVNTGYDNSAATSKINFSAKMLRKNNEFAGVNLQIQGLNKSALGQLLHLAINVNENPAAAEQFQATANKLITQIFTQQSQVQLHVIMPKDEQSGFSLLDAKGYFNTLPQNPTMPDLMTQAQLDANWKIPTYATQMLKIFAPIIISKIEDQQHQVIADNLYNLFEQMLPLTIQQGYLIQQGDYYLSTWNITSRSVLMNSKPVQPLLTQLIQLQQQQQASSGTATTMPMTDKIESVPAFVQPTTKTTKPSAVSH